jgi:ethanolaminephosphotransferase
VYLVSDDQKLRTLELNSWQILRLLQAQMPAFCLEDCINSEGGLGIVVHPESIEKEFCHLLSKAFVSHQSSCLHQGSNFK